MKPLQSGLALSATVSVFYTLCTLIEVFAPEQFTKFMNFLFHGLDFRLLRSDEPYRFQAYFYAPIVMAVWAFVVGAFFGWVRNAIDRFNFHGVQKHG